MLCLIASLSGRQKYVERKTYSNVRELLISHIFGMRYRTTHYMAGTDRKVTASVPETVIKQRQM